MSPLQLLLAYSRAKSAGLDHLAEAFAKMYKQLYEQPYRQLYQQ